jgi:hypothetical protein
LPIGIRLPRTPGSKVGVLRGKGFEHKHKIIFIKEEPICSTGALLLTPEWGNINASTGVLKASFFITE